MLFSFFCPDFCFSSFDEISADFLLEKGITALILDIDNTLAPYEEPEPNARVLSWFQSLKDHGINAAIVSNNHPERVHLFNQSIGIPVYPNGKKPLKKFMKIALSEISGNKENAAIIGDQIFTDVWAGKNVGIRCILVPPIKDKTDPFTKFKRLMEKPILRYFCKHKHQ